MIFQTVSKKHYKQTDRQQKNTFSTLTGGSNWPFRCLGVIHFNLKGVLKNEAASFRHLLLVAMVVLCFTNLTKSWFVTYRYNQCIREFLLVCCSKLVHLVAFRGRKTERGSWFSPPHQIGIVWKYRSWNFCLSLLLLLGVVVVVVVVVARIWAPARLTWVEPGLNFGTQAFG